MSQIWGDLTCTSQRLVSAWLRLVSTCSFSHTGNIQPLALADTCPCFLPLPAVIHSVQRGFEVCPWIWPLPMDLTLWLQRERGSGLTIPLVCASALEKPWFSLPPPSSTEGLPHLVPPLPGPRCRAPGGQSSAEWWLHRSGDSFFVSLSCCF